MRIALSLIIWIVLVGGLGLYVHHRDTKAMASGPTVEIRTAKGSYTLEITTTFNIEPDPFALQTDDQGQPAALLVRMAGQEILRRTERLEAGTPLRLEPLSGLVEGTNEIYLEASPPLEQTDKSQAVRVRIISDGQPLSERTFWSLPGGKVADTWRFTLGGEKGKEGGHDH